MIEWCSTPPVAARAQRPRTDAHTTRAVAGVRAGGSDLLAEGADYNRAHPSAWSHWYTDEHAAVGFWSDYVTWPHVEQYQRVAFESGLATMARDLMQSQTVRFFHEHVLVKEPGATEPTPWHHDDPYYGIDGTVRDVPSTSRTAKMSE